MCKDKNRLEKLSQEEKEDLELLLLMQQADRNEEVSRDEIMDILNQE